MKPIRESARLDWEGKHAKPKSQGPARAEEMFRRISSKTNFAELVERPEWGEIQKKIVHAIRLEVDRQQLLIKLRYLASFIHFDRTTHSNLDKDLKDCRFWLCVGNYRLIVQSEALS